jgi:putative addiction module CopG family antidote
LPITATASLEKMTIHLNPEQEHRPAEAVRSGSYGSADDVISQALEVLHERDESLLVNRQAIDSKIQTGLAELDRGEGIPDDEVEGHLERLRAQPE